jgi:hypothetical protein
VADVDVDGEESVGNVGIEAKVGRTPMWNIVGM